MQSPLSKKQPLQSGSTLTCTLQNEDNSVRAVCFSTEKHPELKTLQQTKSPVKITNYNTSANNGKEDIILLSKTKITPITSDDINFPYSGELTAATGILPNLLALEKLAAEQPVTIKAQLRRCLQRKHYAHNTRVSSKNKNYSSEKERSFLSLTMMFLVNVKHAN